MSSAAAANATNITARKKKALDFVEKVKQESAMREMKTEAKKEETEGKKEETEAKKEETEAKKEETKVERKVEAVVEKLEAKIVALAEELKAATSAIGEMKMLIVPPAPPPCKYHAARRCWHGPAGTNCRWSHGTFAGAAWRSGDPAWRSRGAAGRSAPSPPSSPARSPRTSRSPGSSTGQSKHLLEPPTFIEPSCTSFPRVAASTANCRWLKNTLGASDDVTDKFVTDNEDEKAAAAIAKSLVRQVVEAEEKEFIASLANKAAQLEAKYEAKYKPVEDEDGVTRSPILPRYTLNLAKVNQFLHKKLPKPLMLPIMGCSVDADLYTMCTIHGKPAGSCKVQVPEQCDCAARELARPKPRTLLGHVASTLAAPCPHNKGSKGATEDACNGSTVFDMGKCFGFAHGFVTDVGIVAPPSDPVFGFIYHEGEYKLFAEPA